MRLGLQNALKYVIPSFIAGTLFMGGAAWAGTNLVQATKGTSSIQANGKTVANPPKLVYNGTTYVQLYAIQHALINSGINASWNGSTFAMTVPDSASSTSDTSPVLDGVYFLKGTDTSSINVKNDLYQLPNVLSEIPTSTANQGFITYIAADNVTANKQVTVKEVLYGPDGAEVDSQTDNWAPTSTSLLETFTWDEAISQGGYYTVKVYLDNQYIGQGKLWAYDPS